jgi:hypothetical protein
MAGLVPAIPIKTAKRCQCYRDARHKAGHDAEGAVMAGLVPVYAAFVMAGLVPTIHVFITT